MRLNEDIEVRSNLEILGFDRGKKRVLAHLLHNIVVTNGRKFLCENVAAASFAGASFTRQQNTVVRYIGFGIGGNRQTEPAATTPPLSSTYPTGYGGTNAQNDVTVGVGGLERPVLATATHWMKEVAAPATFLSDSEVQWQATFDQLDLNLAPYTEMPISEIMMYSSAADPTLPNGVAGTYPGGAGAGLAYDVFDSFNKHGAFSVLVKWAWRF